MSKLSSSESTAGFTALRGLASGLLNTSSSSFWAGLLEVVAVEDDGAAAMSEDCSFLRMLLKKRDPLKDVGLGTTNSSKYVSSSSAAEDLLSGKRSLVWRSLVRFSNDPVLSLPVLVGVLLSTAEDSLRPTPVLLFFAVHLPTGAKFSCCSTFTLGVVIFCRTGSCCSCLFVSGDIWKLVEKRPSDKLCFLRFFSVESSLGGVLGTLSAWPGMSRRGESGSRTVGGLWVSAKNDSSESGRSMAWLSSE
uniref:(northern house mosquito) hypothetical protein n=2 Tax=Culex pipiens TaxID=7175 RepID=A0A8D8NZH9_CULPI